MTLIEESAIAAAGMIGESRIPAWPRPVVTGTPTSL
jgi:hypothetical protein